jgi:serine/threonine protein phosphatase PrpC
MKDGRTTYEHTTTGGLRLRVAAEIRRGPHPVPGEPFAAAATGEGGFVIGLCDGTGDWYYDPSGSRVAAATMIRMLMPARADMRQRLRDAMQLGGLALTRHAANDPSGEGGSPTAVAATIFVHERAAHIAWVGDLPVVLLRAGRIEAQTRPHLLVNDLIEAGQLTVAQAADFPHRNVISRGLGPSANVEVVGPWSLLDRDRIVLGYERVTRFVPIDALAGLVEDVDPERATTRILDAAAEAGRFGEAAVIVMAVGVDQGERI